MNILLIEDEKLICSSLKIYLEKNDRYSVNIAFNGQDALYMLQDDHFDMVLTDLNLPDFKEFELVEEIRTRNADIPIITVSAQYPDTKNYCVIKHNIFKCITKPFDLEVVSYYVADALKCRI